MTIKVGTLKKLKRECLGNRAGTVGVCYEVYELGGHKGASFIFPNGSYDGFSLDEMDGIKADFYECFDEWEGYAHSVADYDFTNVMQLSEDFRKGIFDKALVFYQ